MKKIFFRTNNIIFVFLLWSYLANGLRESDSQARYALLKQLHFYQIKEFQGEKGVTLRLARFGQGVGEKGSLVFINGWAESLFKYIELFYDLNREGFSPIYTYDHRGQGFSDRLLKDQPYISYVEDYSFYEKDMRLFINQVLKDPEVQKEKLFAVGHSMGGHIILDYLQKGGVSFKAVILGAPMLKMQIMPSIIEFFLLNLMRGVCVFDCSVPVPGVSMDFSRKHRLTSSQERIAFAKYIAQNKTPNLLNQVSYQWVLKSVSAGHRIMNKEKIQKIKTPLLILQAEKEVLVSNFHQNQFCKTIPQFCRIKTLKGARHELFLETDHIRDQAIKAIIQFR